MKKLLLIVFVGLIASRVLSHRDHRHERTATRPPTLLQAIFDDQTQPPESPQPQPPLMAPVAPEPPDAIRIIPWNRAESHRGDQPGATGRTIRIKRRPAPPRVETALATTAPGEAPAWFPKSAAEEADLARPDAAGSRVLLGRLSISEERARTDLRTIVNREVADWLAADVPMDWAPPRKLVDRMVQGTYIKEAAAPEAALVPELDSTYTLHRAGQKLDFSAARRDDFLRSYHRDLASARMKRSGGVIAVVLASLALMSVYIRADEATKGYYTARLRALALAGLGAAGAVAYRYWS